MSQPATEIVIRRMRQRRDTAANWTTKNPVLDAGEIGFEVSATGVVLKQKAGNGVLAWSDLPYLPVTLAAKAVSETNLDDTLRAGIVRDYPAPTTTPVVAAGGPVVAGYKYLWNGHLYLSLVTLANAPAPLTSGLLDPARFRDISGTVDTTKFFPAATTSSLVDQVAVQAYSPIAATGTPGFRDIRTIAGESTLVSEKWRDGDAPLQVSGAVSIDMSDQAVGSRMVKLQPTGPLTISPTNVAPGTAPTAQVLIVRSKTDPGHAVTFSGTSSADAVDGTAEAKILVSVVCVDSSTYAARVIETWKVLTYADRMRAKNLGQWLKLDELTGTVLADSSGNGRNGNALGGLTLGQTTLATGDPAGKAVVFDGVDDYIEVDSLANSGIIDPTKSFTLGWLLQPAAAQAGAQPYLFSAGKVTTGAETSTVFNVFTPVGSGIPTGQVRVLMRNSAGTSYYDITSTATPLSTNGIEASVWFVHNAATGKARLYYASNFSSAPIQMGGPTDSGAANIITPPTGNFVITGATIGARRIAGAPSNFYAGKMDEFFAAPYAMAPTDFPLTDWQ